MSGKSQSLPGTADACQRAWRRGPEKRSGDAGRAEDKRARLLLTDSGRSSRSPDRTALLRSVAEGAGILFTARGFTELFMDRRAFRYSAARRSLEPAAAKASSPFPDRARDLAAG